MLLMLPLSAVLRYLHRQQQSTISPFVCQCCMPKWQRQASAQNCTHDRQALSLVHADRLGVMEDLQPITLQALRSPSPASPAHPHSPPFQTQQHAQHAQHGTVPSTAERQDMAAGQVEQDTLLRLHSVFSQQHNVKLRHLAFMLLSRLGGLPPTLYRPLEEPEVVGPQGG